MIFYKLSINISKATWLFLTNFLVPQRFSSFSLPFFSCIDYGNSIKRSELIRVAVNRRIWDKLDQFLHFPSIIQTKLHPSIANTHFVFFWFMSMLIFYFWSNFWELVEKSPLIKIKQGDEGAYQWWKKLFSVIIVVINLIALFKQHVLKQRNRSVLQRLVSFYYQVFQSLPIFWHKHWVNIFKSFCSLSMRRKILWRIFSIISLP
jgi:hypothetical protein